MKLATITKVKSMRTAKRLVKLLQSKGFKARTPGLSYSRERVILSISFITKDYAFWYESPLVDAVAGSLFGQTTIVGLEARLEDLDV